MSTAIRTDDFGAATGRDTVRIERLLPGPVERLWSYLTDPEKRRSWFAGGPMEQRAGAPFELVFRNGELDSQPPAPAHAKWAGEIRSQARVIACEPPRLLVFAWLDDHGDESEVRFELTPRGEKVQLVLTHSRLGSRKDMVNVSGGWHAHLLVLADRLAGRQPTGFWSTLAEVEPEYEKRIPQ